MNSDQLTTITALTLKVNGVVVPVTLPATLIEQVAMTQGFLGQMKAKNPAMEAIVTAVSPLIRTLTYIGEFNGCCAELSWTETFAVVAPVLCVFDLCTYIQP